MVLNDLCCISWQLGCDLNDNDGCVHVLQLNGVMTSIASTPSTSLPHNDFTGAVATMLDPATIDAQYGDMTVEQFIQMHADKLVSTLHADAHSRTSIT